MVFLSTMQKYVPTIHAGETCQGRRQLINQSPVSIPIAGKALDMIITTNYKLTSVKRALPNLKLPKIHDDI
jgi:hypothetical protein